MLSHLVDKQIGFAKPQPQDPNHTRLARDVIEKWCPDLDCRTVLDVGCGSGFCKPIFEVLGYEWTGTAIGKDFENASAAGLNVVCMDMHEAFGDFGLVFARHVLEHSPFPVVALDAWRKMARYCIVVVPRLEKGAYSESTHLSILPRQTWVRYFLFCDLKIVKYEDVDYNNPPPWPQHGGEWRFLLERK